MKMSTTKMVILISLNRTFFQNGTMCSQTLIEVRMLIVKLSLD